MDSDLSEKRSEISEFCSEAVPARGGFMSSVATVNELSRELGALLAPDGGWKDRVSAIHRKLTSEHFEFAIPKLTWNRVKTWFFNEARRVDYEEVVALKELKAREEAIREHNNFVATTNRLAAALAVEGAALNRRQMAALERIASRSAYVPGNRHAGSGSSLRRLDRPGVAA